MKTRKELEAELWRLRALSPGESNAVTERNARFAVGLDRLMEAGKPLPLPEPSTLPPEYQGPRTYILTQPCFRGALLAAGTMLTVVNEKPSKTWRPITEDELRVLVHRAQKQAYQQMKRDRAMKKRFPRHV